MSCTADKETDPQNFNLSKSTGLTDGAKMNVKFCKRHIWQSTVIQIKEDHLKLNIKKILENGTKTLTDTFGGYFHRKLICSCGIWNTLTEVLLKILGWAEVGIPLTFFQSPKTSRYTFKH